MQLIQTEDPDDEDLSVNLQTIPKAPEREKWSGKVDFLLSVVGFAVDLGNIWRFPYLCFKNGGGVFLIPYSIMVLVTGVPLFYMELSLGQYYRKGAITTWGRICPLFKGIGYCVVMTALYVDLFYNVIIAWGFHFLYTSFSWNEDGIAECKKLNTSTKSNKISAAEEYFYKGFLGLHEAGVPNNHVFKSLSELGEVHWDIVLSLAIVYLICYFSMWKGIQMSGKVVWFTALFPYFVLGGLFIRGVSLPGWQQGIEYYLRPNFEKLLEPSVWQDAATQVFFSLGPGFGVLMAFSSYNDFHNNVYVDALFTSFVNCATSFLSGFVIFSVLGYMSCKSGKPIEEVAQEGPGLVFVVYPEALSTMPWAPFWSVLFFLMLITLGLDSSFGGSEAIVTGLSDEFPIIKRNREIFIFLLFSLYMCIGVSMCTDGGILVMEWLIVYGTTWALLIAVFCEVMVVAYIYGLHQLVTDMKEMMGFSPGVYWKLCWCIGAPFILFTMIVSHFINYQPLNYQDYAYSETANRFGLFFALSAASFIPTVGIYKLLTARGKTFSEKWRRVTMPYRKRPEQNEYMTIPNRNVNDIML